MSVSRKTAFAMLFGALGALLGSRTVLAMLIGAWGAFLGWGVLDLLLRIRPVGPLSDAAVNGAVVGGCIAGLLSLCDSLGERNLRRFWRRLLCGSFTGMIGGLVGLLLGEIAFQSLGRSPLWRMLGWAVFGLGIGVAEGLASRSQRRLLHGALGGVLGGLVGSDLFLQFHNLQHLPMTGRAAGFTLLGLLLGFSIGAVQILLRTAWIRVISSGPQEGREFGLESNVVWIGRDDSLPIGLYDPSVLSTHARIAQEGEGYVLYPATSQAVVMVNEQPIHRHVLQAGDRIRIGTFLLQFHARQAAG